MSDTERGIWIIAGLGNPGSRYTGTRHNTGFLCADELAARHGAGDFRAKFHSLLTEADISGARCLIIKPQTFMNLSGTAVGEAAGFYKVPPERVVMLFDDAELPLGRIRVRPGGRDGGHNGVADICRALGTERIPRVKVGIGRPANPDYPLADWVLGRFTPDELVAVTAGARRAADAVECLIAEGVPAAMNRFNGAVKEE